MTKSLIWRFLILFIILSAWAYSLFPLTDQPFIETVEKLASNKDKQFERLMSQTKTHPLIKSNPPEALLATANKLQIKLNNYFSLKKKKNAKNKELIHYLVFKSKGKIRLGIDLSGGTEFIISFDSAVVEKAGRNPKDVRDEIIEILRNRIDQFGVVDPEIKPIGDSNISLTTPGTKPEEIAAQRKIIAQPAKLEFRLVHKSQAQNRNDKAPLGYELMEVKSEDDSQEAELLFVKRRPEAVNGSHVVNCKPDVDNNFNHKVLLSFNREGANLFYDLTKNNLGRRMAIVLDNTVYSAPTIRKPIPGGSAEITGSFTLEEASRLAIVIRSGKLPVAISIEGEFSTSPTLGKEMVKSGIWAAIGGLIVVMLFMLIYYTTAGLIADLALLANILLIMGTLTIAGATLTLPGIAGIVLTIGMAVDANVLIFERIREEITNRKSLSNAIKNGYDRAFWTILDANLTTLFAASALIMFGSGPVKGFAVTLSIGIIASMFTALFMTRLIFDALLFKKLLTRVYMLQWLKVSHFNFIQLQRIGLWLSVMILAASLMVFFYRGDSALGVDFAGGTALTMNFRQAIPAPDIKEFLEKSGYDNLRVSYKSSAIQETQLLEIILPLSSQKAQETDLLTDIQEKLNNQYPANYSNGSIKTIGALVGKRFTRQACWAIFWALILILIYISFRFEFAYAIGAVAALTHDLIICTGIFLIVDFGDRQISLPVIAALLTIIGYSLNDTIVLFDRIRENLSLLPKDDFHSIINVSINQILSRTLLTSVTTLLVILSLYLFGGGAINDFAMIMLSGIIIGTYSSIVIATPAMMLYRRRRNKHQANIDSTIKVPTVIGS